MNIGIIISTSHEYCITMQHAWILLYLTAYNYSNNILVSLSTTHKGGRLNWNYSRGISQFLTSTVYIIVTTLYNCSKICMLFSFNKLKSGVCYSCLALNRAVKFHESRDVSLTMATCRILNFQACIYLHVCLYNDFLKWHSL